MDLENIARKSIETGKGKKEAVEEIEKAVRKFKDWEEKKAKKFSEAVYEEVKASLGFNKVKDAFLKEVLGFYKTNVRAGEAGVGSRGKGDFAVHRAIAEIIGKKGFISVLDQDDAGALFLSTQSELVQNLQYIVAAVDGMHSRLSEFPFLAGFHAARAALRDICVKGALPIALLADVRIGDDGDIGKLLDFTSGIAAVSELTNAPLIAGSTLRIGGDMVFGERLIGTVGAIGTAEKLFARKFAEEGDVILATEGKGGGTVSTIAIFHGEFKAVKETLNVDFVKACNAVLSSSLKDKLHVMSDVTNGGIRGDASEIAKTSGKKLVFYEDKLKLIVSPKIREMLEKFEIDSLGISTDSLLLILPESSAKEAKKIIGKVTRVYEIGYVAKPHKKTAGAFIIKNGKEKPFEPMFREAAYTKIKKIIGEEEPANFEEILEKIEEAKRHAIEKKNRVREFVEGA